MDLVVKGNQAKWGETWFRCRYGRYGFTSDKSEGDGKTPIGKFPFRSIYYRPDRISEKLITKLPLYPITPTCGWCDDPERPEYNRYIQKPFAGSHEDLCLEKPLYDLLIVVGHNDNPVIKGKGSAIFIHIAPENEEPTAGCIGLQREDLISVIKEADADSSLIIETYQSQEEE